MTDDLLVVVDTNVGSVGGIAQSPDTQFILWTDDSSDSVFRKNLSTGVIDSIGGENGAKLGGITVVKVGVAQ